MDSVVVIPRSFNAPPFYGAVLVFILQLTLWPLSALQLMRGWAWMSEFTPLGWALAYGIYAGLCLLLLLVAVAYLFAPQCLGRDMGTQLQRHYHPNLSATIYLLMSFLAASPVVMILVYYHLHYSGASPNARSTGDVTPALQRLAVYTAGHLLGCFASLLGIYQFLTNVIVPSIFTLRYFIETNRDEMLSATGGGTGGGSTPSPPASKQRPEMRPLLARG